MSVLKVGALQSPSASSNNIVLNSDGSIATSDGGTFVSNNYLNSGVTTLTDSQGNVRSLERTAITSTPHVISSGSSGKYFSLGSGSANVDFHTANVTSGDIMTFYNHQSSNANFNFTGMTNGVYIAGTDEDKTGGGLGNTLVFSPRGVVTVICDATGRLIFNGNVR